MFFTTSDKKLPPGPMKLPVIGNLHNLVGSLPHHALRDLSLKYGPLMHLQLGQISAIVVSSPSMARKVMKTHDLSFSQRPRVMAVQIAAYDDLHVAFAPYGEYWKQMKNICIKELLSPGKVRSLSHVRDAEARSLVEFIERSPPPSLVNLTERLYLLMCGITCRLAIGEKSSNDAELISVLREGSLLAGGFNLADVFPSVKFLERVSGMRQKLEKIHERSDQILQLVVDEHIRRSQTADGSGNKEEDLVDVLLRLQKSCTLRIPISSENIKAVICDMFTAGTDTAAKTVEWAMAEMMRNPAVMDKAQAEVRKILKGQKVVHEADIQGLSYLKLVIKETLRLHPPAPLSLPRECREACTLAGYDIPEKTKLIVNVWAIGRDPEVWDDAESFRPERFEDSHVDYKGSHFEFLPFGAGRRVCPGIHFATTNVELALVQLLYHFDWDVPSGSRRQDLDMTEVFGATVGGKTTCI